jgi:hypothetical protein
MLQDAVATNVTTVVPSAAPEVRPDVVPGFTADQKLLLRDAATLVRERICQNIDAALLVARFPNPIRYSEPTKQLLHDAWTLAAHLHNREVTIDHLIAALVNGDEEAGIALSKAVRNEPNNLLAGALVRVAVLDVIAGAHAIEVLQPSDGLVKWIIEASRLAAEREITNNKLAPDDLVACLNSPVTTTSVKRSVLSAVRQASQVGRTQGELVKARRGIDSVKMTTSFFRSETGERFGKLAKKLDGLAAGQQQLDDRVAAVSQQIPDAAALDTRLAAVAGLTLLTKDTNGTVIDMRRSINDGFANVTKGINALNQRAAPEQVSEPADTSHAILAALRDAEVRQTAKLDGLAVDVAGSHRQLADLDRQTTAIKNALPRPPSAGRIGLAISGALALGIIAGLALTPAPKDGWIAAGLNGVRALVGG